MATSSSHNEQNCTEPQLNIEKNRNMFDYSLSKPWYPTHTEWSSKRNNNHHNQRNHIKDRFPFEWNDTYINISDPYYSIIELSYKRKKMH